MLYMWYEVHRYEWCVVLSHMPLCYECVNVHVLICIVMCVIHICVACWMCCAMHTCIMHVCAYVFCEVMIVLHVLMYVYCVVTV